VHDSSVFDFFFTWPPWWYHVHDPSSLLRQFWDKLGNPSQTCFQTKQAVGSRCVSHAVLFSSILWCIWQTIVHFEAQTEKTSRWFWGSNYQTGVVGFEAQTGKLSILVLRLNQETHAHCLLVYGADRTWYHPTSRSPTHQIPDLCLTILGSLHRVSYVTPRIMKTIIKVINN
jgi:hypothetical protein